MEEKLTKDKLWEIVTNSEDINKIIATALVMYEKDIQTENLQAPSITNCFISSKVTTMTEDELKQFVISWRELFRNLPKNLNIGMGTLNKQIERMKLFVTKVSSNKEKIIAATENYINDCIQHNRISKLPEYFILEQQKGNLDKADLTLSLLYEFMMHRNTTTINNEIIL